MSRFEVACPGCRKLIAAFNKKSVREQMLRHARNCDALRKMATPAPEAKP